MVDQGKYSLNAYIVLLKTQANLNVKRVLVEGKRDKHFFMVLFHELSIRNNRRTYTVRIDSAKDFIDSRYFVGDDESRRGLGAREMVERICSLIANEKCASNLIGFVDREFRRFGEGNITDEIREHHIENRIIWSRGHSVENYVFDRDVLAETLRCHLVVEWFEKAISLFESYFEFIMIIACAISMSAKESGKLGVIQESEIDWRLLEIRDKQISFDIEQWLSRFRKAKKEGKGCITESEAKVMAERYLIWQDNLSSMDFSLVRWLCHGHIGFSAVLSLFKFCTAETCPDRNENNPPGKYLGNFKEDKHFSFCINAWLSKVFENSCEHPLEAFQRLGFEIY